MKNINIWWKNYYGFMIIPFLVMTFLFNTLSNYSKIAYFAFIAWMLFNAVDFYRRELSNYSKKEK